MTGAIIIIGTEAAELSPDNAACDNGSPDIHVASWLVEVLGCSLLERTIQDLRRCAQHIAVIADQKWKSFSAESGTSFQSSLLRWSENAWVSAAEQLHSFQSNGINECFVISATGYAELDFPDLFQCHCEQRNRVTRVDARSMPIDAWVVNAADPAQFVSNGALDAKLLSGSGATYSPRGYVNALQGAQDFRKLATDGLSTSCGLRPYGHEIRPGVWVGDNAQIHRGARIVAPAFIGRSARIEEQCLITRCSDIESNCRVDYGTVVEDSAVLANTYIGIGLDITHSLVYGNTLINLERDVALRIADQGVIRANRLLRKEANRSSAPALRLVETR